MIYEPFYKLKNYKVGVLNVRRCEKDKLEPPKNNNIKAGWLDHYEI